MTKVERLVALTQAVRSVFNRLKTLGDQLHSDTEITTAMRAVMESLHARGPMTVPQIAKLKSVSRQHIQMRVDTLCTAGLAVVKDNPAHKRSSLIALTDKGTRSFERMSTREAPFFSELARGLDADEIAVATRVLAQIAAFAEARITEEFRE